MTARTSTDPGRTARVMLIACVLGATYLDFFRYKATGFDDRHVLDARLLGQSPAPEQYRVGVYWLAHWMVAHLHIAPTMAFAVLDGVAATVAVLLLYNVLERSGMYAYASALLRWLGAAVFVLAVLWFMAWLLWLQKPETLPTAGFVAAMLWLWEPQERKSMRWWTAPGLVLLTAVLATFRADVACLLNVGICIFLVLQREELSLPRPAAMTTAAIGAIGAGGLQFWLMRVAYPSASYGPVKMWQLWPNVKHGSRWPPFAIFLLPLGWMAVQGVRHGFPKDAGGRAFLLAGGLYAVLWFTIGKIDEVRIFLPFALALTPLLVHTVMQRVERQGG